MAELTEIEVRAAAEALGLAVVPMADLWIVEDAKRQAEEAGTKPHRTAGTSLKLTVSDAARATGVAAGVDVQGLVGHAHVHLSELTALLHQIIALHPADDPNLTALESVLAGL
jgi:hypothetical protein